MTRVLVVEDDAQMRDTLVGVLRLWGFNATAVGCGADALRLQQEGERFDLGILDLGLPDMDGTEIALELRRQGPIALLAVTGQTERLGELPPGLFDTAFGKPFRSRSIREAIFRLLGRSHGADLALEDPGRIAAST